MFYDDEGQLTLAIDAATEQPEFGYDRLDRVVGKVMRTDLPLGNALREGNASPMTRTIPPAAFTMSAR